VFLLGPTWGLFDSTLQYDISYLFGLFVSDIVHVIVTVMCNLFNQMFYHHAIRPYTSLH